MKLSSGSTISISTTLSPLNKSILQQKLWPNIFTMKPGRGCSRAHRHVCALQTSSWGSLTPPPPHTLNDPGSYIHAGSPATETYPASCLPEIIADHADDPTILIDSRGHI